MTSIPIESLTTGTLIYCPYIDDAAEVQDIRFDGVGYMLDLTYGIYNDREETMYVAEGETVRFEGLGSPKLLSDDHVAAERAHWGLDEVTTFVCEDLMSRYGSAA